MKRARSFRRSILGTLAAATLAAPIVWTSGCSGDYLPSDLVNGLRVFTVVADKPYAAPGDSVTFSMKYWDGAPDPEGDGPRAVQILWIGGCVNPPGDLYYGCFPQLAQVFASLKPGQLPPPGLIQVLPDNIVGEAAGTFTTTVPLDIISSRPPPEGGSSKYGLMYVFFAACAGNIRPVELDPSGKAGFFPFACFDDAGNRLPADSFVPGYTQIYSFEDSRANENPTAKGMTLDKEAMPEDPTEAVTVKPCPSTEEERRSVGCFAGDPYEGCKFYEIDVDVEKTIAEIDPGEKLDDKQLFEAVWVDYYVDGGDLTGGGIRLISGVTEGYKEDHKTAWIPPSTPGLYSIWATLRDTRGGASILRRYIRVE